MSPEHLNKLLAEQQPNLSTAEKQVVWKRISSRVQVPQAVPSPYSFFTTLQSRVQVGVAVLLVLIIVTSGTVTVADAAKPGDLLFPIERAAERARLAFASPAKVAQLRSDLALERYAELEAILAEEGTLVPGSLTRMSGVEDASFKAEADVYTDITVIKVEANTQKSLFTTPLKTEEAVISFILDRFEVATSTVEKLLDFEIKNRISQAGERELIAVSDRAEARISVAINELLNQLEEVDDAVLREQIFGILLSQIDNIAVPGRSENIRPPLSEQRLRIDENRIEVRDDSYRIRIESDGDVRIKLDEASSSKEEYKKSERDDHDDDAYQAVTKVEDEQDDLQDEDDRSKDDEVKEDKQREVDTQKEDNERNLQETDRGDDDVRLDQDDNENQDREDDELESESDSEALRKIEVRVEGNEAEVKIEFIGSKLEYKTTYTTKENLIADIAARTGYTTEAVAAVTSFEIKD